MFTSKKELLLIGIVLVVLSFSLAAVSASDVAYIYEKSVKVDNTIISTLSDMNLSVDLIQSGNLNITNLSNYKLIFVGDEVFHNANIPVSDFNSVIVNYYYGPDWGLTDNDAITQLASNRPSKMIVNHTFYQAYTQALDSNGIALPYYYLANLDRANSLTQVAGATPDSPQGGNLGDIISYASPGALLENGKITKGNLCFFGLVKSQYWTPLSKQLFEDCVNFAITTPIVNITCNTNSDCGNDNFTSGLFCSNNSVVQNKISFSCMNPGSASSFCSNSTSVVTNQTCSINQSCSNATCIQNPIIVCNANSDCGNDSLSSPYCSNGNVAQDNLTFTCNNAGNASSFCSNSTSTTIAQACSNGCQNNSCIFGIHDVALVSSDNNFVNNIKIRTNTSDSSSILGDILDCNQKYQIVINVSDIGNFNETVSFSGQLGSLPLTYSSTNLTVEQSKEKYNTVNVTLPEGIYNITVNASIPTDNNLSNNVAIREVNVSCPTVPPVINCTTNLDCGNDSLIDGLFCSQNNLTQQKQVFTCNNAGNPSSFCSSNIINLTNQVCSDYCSNNSCAVFTCHNDTECNDNNSSTTDVCQNPSTINSTCIHTPIPITCSSNLDCGQDKLIGNLFCSNNSVSQDKIMFTCNSPGDINSSCSNSTSVVTNQTCSINQECNNGSCVSLPIACSTDLDCGTSGFVGSEFCSNNSVAKNFLNFTCNNAGNPSSFCSNSTSAKIVSECQSDFTCNNGECIQNPSLIDLSINNGFTKPRELFTNGTKAVLKFFTNNTGSDSLNVSVNVILDGNLLSEFPMLPFAPGYNLWGINASGVPGVLAQGSHNLTIITDPNNQILESNENNNIFTLIYNVSNVSVPQNITCSNNTECNDGNPLTFDQCISPGTSDSICRHTTVNCASDLDCGTSGFIGQESCSANDIMKNFQNSTCNNAGTPLSFCTTTVSQSKVSECQFACTNATCIRCDTNNDCSDNNPNTEDQCINPGTIESHCSNQQVVCSTNSDCNDNSSSTIDTCNNAGTVNSFCSYAQIACSSSSDCGSPGFTGAGFCSNNKVLQNFSIPSCINPGTASSFCSDTKTLQVTQNCNVSCSQGTCILDNSTFVQVDNNVATGNYNYYCPPGFVATGVRYHDKGGAGDNFISGLYCSNINIPSLSQDNITIANDLPMGEYVYQCPSNEILFGVNFHDKGNAITDSFVRQIFCGNYSANLNSPTAVKLGVKPIESLYDYRCPLGSVISGVNFMDGNSTDKFVSTLYCSNVTQ